MEGFLFFPLAVLAAVLPGPAVDCGGGVAVHLTAADVAQGGVVLAEITGLPSSSGLEAKWESRAVPRWQEGPGSPLRVLLGVDLERPEGVSTLSITRPDSPACSVSVNVRAGDFVVRRLQVPKRYVELSPRDQARAEGEAARLEAVFADVTGERLWDGPFRLPLAGTPPSDNFGQRRILNGEPRSPHAGVDFSAPAGTPIHATGRGRVVLAATLFFSGRTVVLDHGLGVFSFYGHLSATSVRTGEVVAAGARLGNVGATGRATGPHLHWSVRLSGARVNPLRLVDLGAAAVSAAPAGAARRR